MEKQIQNPSESDRDGFFRTYLVFQSSASARTFLSYPFFIVFLCIHLVLDCSISFRSVPRILKFLQPFLSFPIKIPHYTTIIRWVKRVGLGILGAPVRIGEKWVGIIDSTIQVGCNKALVMLKVSLDTLKQCVTLTFDKVQFILLRLTSSCTGELVREELRQIFTKHGPPVEIVSDQGSDLQKGFKAIQSECSCEILIMVDITHLIANHMKKAYANDPVFGRLNELTNQTRQRIQQTRYSHLSPPRQRSKARFQGLPDWSAWLSQMLHFVKAFLSGTYQGDPFPEEEIRSYFGWLLDYEQTIEAYAQEQQELMTIQKILKTEQFTPEIYQQVRMKLKELKTPGVEEALETYLEENYKYYLKSGNPTLFTSDILESLFGKFKRVSSPNSSSELNGLTLSMGCIGRDLNEEAIETYFELTTTMDVQKWEQKHVGTTMLSKKKKWKESMKKNEVKDTLLIGQKTAEVLIET